MIEVVEESERSAAASENNRTTGLIAVWPPLLDDEQSWTLYNVFTRLCNGNSCFPPQESGQARILTAPAAWEALRLLTGHSQKEKEL